MTREQEIIDKSTKDKKNGFDDWMRNPMTKALISTIPPSEHLEVLLKACFEQGYGVGVASIMMDIVHQVMKRPKD